MRVAALALVLLAACAASRPGLLTRRGARVFIDGASAERVREITNQFEPLVIKALGTQWPRAYEIRSSELPPTMLACTIDATRAVELSSKALAREDLDVTVVHELVHVHATGRWASLPYGVQEGLAFWISLALTRGPDVYAGPQPTSESLWLVLTLTGKEYQRLPHTAEFDQAATWLASRLVKIQPTSPEPGRF